MRECQRHLLVCDAFPDAATRAEAEGAEGGTGGREAVVVVIVVVVSGDPALRPKSKRVGKIGRVVVDGPGRGADNGAGREKLAVHVDSAGQDLTREVGRDGRREAERFIDARAQVDAAA